jgi:hypothetical protein
MKNCSVVFLKSVFAVLSLVCLSACHHYTPLDAAKKAKMVGELINGSKECTAFKQQLSTPSRDDDAIDDVYSQAMRAGCINKDV